MTLAHYLLKDLLDEIRQELTEIRSEQREQRKGLDENNRQSLCIAQTLAAIRQSLEAIKGKYVLG